MAFFELEKHIQPYKDAVFIQSGNLQITFTSFYNRVIQAAINLKSNINKGSIVVCYDIPLAEFPVVLYAIWLCRGICFPINPKLPQTQIKKIIADVNASIIIGNEESKNRFDDGKFFVSKNLLELTSKDIACNGKIDFEQLSTIIMTSGSTGNAKYAVHSFQNHFYNTKGVNHFLNFDSDRSWLLSLPIYHVGGLAIIIRCFFAGAKLHIPKDKSTLIEQQLDDQKPTHISLVPAQLFTLMENPDSLSVLQNCEAVLLGGSPIPQNIIKLAKKHKIKVYSSYGLTEMASTVAIRNDWNDKDPGAVILEFRNVSVNSENEILLKGPCLFQGYLIKESLELQLQDGWFASKDIGTLENNKLQILGRKDNMFISGGENIYPEEIERICLQFEGINRVIVIPRIDKKYGRRPVAFIDFDKSALDSTTIISLLRKVLPSYKVPDYIMEWPADINDASLKIDRKAFKTYIR